jgi:hypothetical protein
MINNFISFHRPVGSTLEGSAVSLNFFHQSASRMFQRSVAQGADSGSAGWLTPVMTHVDISDYRIRATGLMSECVFERDTSVKEVNGETLARRRACREGP